MNLISLVRSWAVILAFLVLSLGNALALSTNITVLPAGYKDTDLNAAIELGGTIRFQTNQVTPLSGTLLITNDIVLDGKITNVVVVTNFIYVTNGTTIQTNVDSVESTTNIASLGDMVGFSGEESNGFRLFEISRGVSVVFDHIQFTNGGGNFGGAISNNGVLTLTNAYFANNRVHGRNGVNGAGESGNGGSGLNAYGGALYNSGTTFVQRCYFVENAAIAGNGGSGKNGAGDSLFGKNGGSGGNGGLAYGGAIYNNKNGVLEITETAFNANDAVAGDGGFAGVGGSGPFPGKPGDAGQGGSAFGGAIYNVASVSNAMCLFVDNLAEGGSSTPQFNSKNGLNGGGAGGGAIANTKTLMMHNSTLTGNRCIGGVGGGAQSGGFIYGGRGGAAAGGGIYNTAIANLTNCTFASCSASNGLGGLSLNPDERHDGPPGIARGGNLSSGVGSMSLINCLIVDGFPSNSFGILKQSQRNLSTDRSCTFPRALNIFTNSAAVRLKPLADNGGATFTMALGSGSAALNKGTNAIGTNLVPVIDQRGTNRDAGSFDIGAYEAKGPFTVAGRITFGDSLPITNVLIDVFIGANTTNAASFSPVTNDFEGNFSFKVDQGEYTIAPRSNSITKLVFTPVTTNVLADIDDLNFTIPGATVSGRILNTAQKAVSGAIISITNISYGQSLSVTSNVKGLYTITNVALGTNVINVARPNSVFIPSAVTTNLIARTNKDINFVVIPTYTVSGVLTVGNKNTLPSRTKGVPIVLRTNSTSVSVSTTNDVQVLTDLSGRFTFTNVISGNYIVTNNAPSLVFKPSSFKIHAISNIVNLKFTVTNAPVVNTNSAPPP